MVCTFFALYFRIETFSVLNFNLITKLVKHLPIKYNFNAGLEDLNSGTDTDDEDNPKKQVPKWAEGTQLRTALLKQCYMGPDVDNIFFTIEDPDLTVMFNQEHRR